jgi:hypothetical protein
VKLLETVKALPRKQQLIIIGVATLVLVGAFLFLTYRKIKVIGADPGVPAILQSKDPQAIYARIDTAKKKTAELEITARDEPKFRAQLAAMDADIRAARQRLPSSAEKATMRQRIEEIARSIPSSIGRVNLVSVSIRESAAKSGAGRGGGSDYQTVEYATQIKADTDGLIAFIDAIEKDDQRFMTVDGFSLSPGAVKVDKDTKKVAFELHGVNLKILTYVYNETAGKRPGSK